MILAKATLQLLERITRSILHEHDRSDEGFRALRQGLAYCWSVAIASSPEHGKPLFEKWLGTRVLTAIERLMGMVIVAISVQMLLDGIASYLRAGT